eukprot:6282216-Ditylum_brightwellii.AAC.1
MLQKDPKCNIQGSAQQIQDRAKSMGLTLEKVEQKIVEGWFGKAKRMKPIAFECGLIDLDNLKFYSKDGPKDEDDFIETLLQNTFKKVGSNLGLRVIVDWMPKCHSELAGEGIEYTWANAKKFLRSVSLEKRKSRTFFHTT